MDKTVANPVASRLNCWQRTIWFSLIPQAIVLTLMAVAIFTLFQNIGPWKAEGSDAAAATGWVAMIFVFALVGPVLAALLLFIVSLFVAQRSWKSRVSAFCWGLGFAVVSNGILWAVLSSSVSVK